MTTARTGMIALALAVGVGCGSAPRGAVVAAVDRGELDEAIAAYERVRSADGPDASLLARVAALLLEQEAASDDRDRRRQVIQELSAAGTAGAPILQRLADGDGPSRVTALEALARRGDESARRMLRGMADDPDPEVRAAAILGMTADDDLALLMEAVAAPNARMRELAAERLAGAAPGSDARMALENASRVDPEPAVRMAAVRALGDYGVAAVAALRERLGDPVASVRMSAVEALLRADRDEARTILGALLETPPSAQGIEAARLLATPSLGEPDPGARAYLRQALLAPDPSHRAQAGVALVSLPGAEEFGSALREALARETDEGAKLSLARALLRQPGDDADARAALRAIATSGASMSALQAAAVLAAERDDTAIGVIAGFLSVPDSGLRRAAARALARDAMRPDDARGALQDHDAAVRISAAGGILAAAAASS